MLNNLLKLGVFYSASHIRGADQTLPQHIVEQYVSISTVFFPPQTV